MVALTGNRTRNFRDEFIGGLVEAHLLGLDRPQLTYPYGGRNFRLTQVYGKVVHDILA
jgi:hypothetical protein